MIDLETYFQHTVDRGWRPVYPCTDATELATLETSLTRGECISPLIQDGDTVYVDRTMKAAPGDIASFALSQRGADAQNTPPMPPGQVPGQWRKGDRWCKLMAVSHGYQMLLDRHGNAATATLMACESPDDVPVLHPVRQIRRAGQLLFSPDCYSPQIGLNAAFASYLTSGSGSGTVAASFSSPTVIGGITVPAQKFDTTVVVTFVSNMAATAGTSGGAGIWAYIDTAVEPFYDSTAGNARCYQATAGLSSVNNVSIEATFALTAGMSPTYNVYAARGGGGTGAAAGYAGWTLKAEVMLR